MVGRLSGHRRVRRHLVWWVWLSYWTALFIVMHIPPPEGLLPGGHSDKFVHFVLYMGLALLGCYSHRLRYHRSSTAALVGWAFLYIMYGALDEWLQGWVDRIPDVWDWVADATGVVVGTVVWLVLRKRGLSAATGSSSSRNP